MWMSTQALLVMVALLDGVLGALQQFDWDISVFWGTRAQQHLAR
jgi:hypothetical protein